MRNISKFFVSFIVGTVLCFPSANAKLNQERLNDLMADLETVDRNYFSPTIVEEALAEWQTMNPYISMRSVLSSAEIISRRYWGHFSVNDLFLICMIAYGKTPEEMRAKEVIDVMWPICITEFISPVVKKAIQTNVLDGVVIEFYDGTRFDQECTPPARVRGWSDVICASGKYAFDPAFEKAMNTKFRTEGGCGYANDSNGITCFGATQKYHPEVNNCDFSRTHAEKIAYEKYYANHNVNLLPDAIRGDVFMGIWGAGSASMVIGWLQNILGVPKTGRVDQSTIEAAKKYRGNLRKEFLRKRLSNMMSLGNWKPNANGWVNGLHNYLLNGCHTVVNDSLQITTKKCPNVTRKDFNNELGSCKNVKTKL